MDNLIEEETLTPMPKIQGKPMTMDFIEAMKRIVEGKKVERISWGGNDYCLMKDGWLTIFTKNAFHTWSINDGDIEGFDWIVLEEKNEQN